MSRLLRAAALAAVTLSIAVGAAMPKASLAGASDETPVTSRYTDHETIAPATDSGLANAIDQTVPATNLQQDAQPVAQHALASIETAINSLDDNAADAGQQPHRSLAELISDYATADVADSELECLATAIYYESKSEPLAGQLAVAEVIINRTKSGRFPASLCGVVKQAGQFSFVRAGRLPSVPRASLDWRQAVAIAKIARDDLADGAAPRALFFHARRVSPNWRLTRVAAVGNHVFYR